MKPTRQAIFEETSLKIRVAGFLKKKDITATIDQTIIGIKNWNRIIQIRSAITDACLNTNGDIFHSV
jgi:hypothetical protein